MRRLWFGLLMALLAGCQSVETQRSAGVEIRGPMRIAVLSCEENADGDQGLAIPLGAMMDVVPLLSDDAQRKEQAREIVRGKLVANLHWTSLEVISPLVVDAELAANPPPSAALTPAEREAYAREVGRVMGVDLVLWSRITEWDRHYVVVASWVTVALEIEVRDARSGRLLVRTELSDVETAGLHKGMIATEPAEIVVVAVGETLRGLRNTLFASLSNELCRVAVQELKGPEDGEAPRIDHLAAGWWGRELRVVALGSPGAKALLTLPGGAVVALPETARGVYQLAFEAKLPAVDSPLRVDLTSAGHRVQARVRAGSREEALPAGR